jgi:hypothetical protein
MWYCLLVRSQEEKSNGKKKKTGRVHPSQLPNQLVKSAIRVMDSIELN